MAQPDPIQAYDRFEQAYLTQHYASAKPTVPEITEVALWLMRTLLGEEGERYVACAAGESHSILVTNREMLLPQVTQTQNPPASREP